MQNSIESLIRRIWIESQNKPVDDVVRRYSTVIRKRFARISKSEASTLGIGLANEALMFIIEDVARVFETTPQNIVQHNRQRQVVILRQMFMFISKALRVAYLIEIGRFSGGRDHTTVIHSCDTFFDLLSVNDPMVTEYWNRYLEQGDEKITSQLNEVGKQQVNEPEELAA